MLRESLGWDYVNAGQIFRDMASEAGMTLAEMGVYAEQKLQVDLQLDERMIQVAHDRPPVVFEGRMTGWMAVRGKLSAHKVWLQASAEHARSALGCAMETLLRLNRCCPDRLQNPSGIESTTASILAICPSTIASSTRKPTNLPQ